MIAFQGSTVESFDENVDSQMCFLEARGRWLGGIKYKRYSFEAPLGE